jgi:hypothetical protein
MQEADLAITLDDAWKHYGQCRVDVQRNLVNYGEDSLETKEARVRVWAASCLIDVLNRRKDQCQTG